MVFSIGWRVLHRRALIHMTSAAVNTVSDSRIGLTGIVKWAAIAVLAGVGFRFFWLHALRYTDVTEHTYRRYWPYRGWLMVHIAGGSLALLLGPLQFFSGLRRWNMRLHRWAGRLYLAGVVTAPSPPLIWGLLLSTGHSGSPWVAMAFAWISCTGMAYLAVRRRQYQRIKSGRSAATW